MKGLICGAIGLIIGGVGGYFVARHQYKKKLEAEISRIEETQAELYNKKVKELTPDTEEEELDGHPDILGLSEEEIANGEAEPCKPNYVDDPNDYIEEEATEEEWIDYDEKAKLEFMKKFEGYVGTSIPYPVNADSIRSSAGALTRIPVARVGSIRNTLKSLQAEGFQIVAATEHSRKLMYDADLTKPTVIVMGSEENGISKEVLKMCDEQLAIPMIGAIESLNVSAAAAIMIYEVVRQRIG